MFVLGGIADRGFHLPGHSSFACSPLRIRGEICDFHTRETSADEEICASTQISFPTSKWPTTAAQSALWDLLFSGIGVMRQYDVIRNFSDKQINVGGDIWQKDRR
jgi:hypothetical protein